MKLLSKQKLLHQNYNPGLYYYGMYINVRNSTRTTFSATDVVLCAVKCVFTSMCTKSELR